MYSKIVKYTCLAALLLAFALPLTGISHLLFLFVVCGGASFVMMQAARSHKYLWVGAFAVIAIYFNPVIPVILSRPASVTIGLACCLVFVGSIFYLRPLPRMSLATITDLPGRGEAL